MGFFSWRTQDTDKSIANKWSARDTFRVQMMDDKGNVWTEDSYDGYGEFGGKDYYELLAEMNGITANNPDELRGKGIELAFSKNNHSGVGTEGVLYPNLVEMAEGWRYDPMGPDSCEDQGFFYDDETEETDWDEFEDEESEF
jgi:hypothetical protein